MTQDNPTIEDVEKIAFDSAKLLYGESIPVGYQKFFKDGYMAAASLNRQGWTRVEVVGLLELLREQGWLHNPYVSNEEMINEYKSK